jgi:hypothetical protein
MMALVRASLADRLGRTPVLILSEYGGGAVTELIA